MNSLQILPRFGAIGLLLFSLPAAAESLFVGEPKAEHVAQGNSGTCYIHAVLASVAHQQPELLKKRMTQSSGMGGSKVTIRLGGGKTEVVYLRDVKDVRTEGADRSTGGLWVPTLLKAYGQSLLRSTLGVQLQSLSLLSQPLIAGALERDPLFVGTIDSTVRLALNTEGQLDERNFARKLRHRFGERVGMIPPGFLDFVVSKGSLQAIARLVEKYPAVYGSWRIGKGGQPARAAQDLFGGRCRTLSASTGSLRRARQALSSRGFVMSATGGKVCPNKGMNWWTDHHAYSVLEAGPQGILVRNPWATTLSPRWMSEQTFMSCMGRVYVCQ